MTDAFMTKIAGHLVDGTPADQTVSEFAAACGATDQSIHKFANEYVNSLYSSGIDYAVRQSQGNLTTEQIESHLEKCSNSYRKSLMISLHLNNLSAAFELIKAVKTNKIM